MYARSRHKAFKLQQQSDSTYIKRPETIIFLWPQGCMQQLYWICILRLNHALLAGGGFANQLTPHGNLHIMDLELHSGNMQHQLDVNQYDNIPEKVSRRLRLLFFYVQHLHLSRTLPHHPLVFLFGILQSSTSRTPAAFCNFEKEEKRGWGVGGRVVVELDLVIIIYHQKMQAPAAVASGHFESSNHLLQNPPRSICPCRTLSRRRFVCLFVFYMSTGRPFSFYLLQHVKSGQLLPCQ